MERKSQPPERYSTEDAKEALAVLVAAEKRLTTLGDLGYTPLPGTLEMLAAEIRNLAGIAAAGELLDLYGSHLTSRQG